MCSEGDIPKVDFTARFGLLELQKQILGSLSIKIEALSGHCLDHLTGLAEQRRLEDKATRSLRTRKRRAHNLRGQQIPSPRKNAFSAVLSTEGRVVGLCRVN